MQRLIPSLLLVGKRLVKGVCFRDYRDAGSPRTTARAYDAQGADEIIVLDIGASRHRRPPDVDSLREVARECSVPVTIGGGIQSLEDAHACMGAGADKICVTTPALDNPSFITQLARRYGSQAVVLGVDVLRQPDGPALYDHRTRQSHRRDALEWITEGVDRGAGEIRLMAVDREGQRNGMDIDLFTAARAEVKTPIILEGGCGTLEHLDAAFAAGVDGVAVGTMLVFSDNNIVKIKRYLAERGRHVRV